MNKIVTFFHKSSLARFLIPMGIMLIIFGVIMFVINTKNQNYIKTEAVVSNVELEQAAYTDTDGTYVEATYTVYLKYTVNERQYTGSLGGLSKYNVGDKMTVYYNPDDPSHITQTKSLILPLVIIAAGLIALVVGIINGINAIKK